jgi:hypothetical protein
MSKSNSAHPGEGRDPDREALTWDRQAQSHSNPHLCLSIWFPAFAGMSGGEK